MERRLIGEYEAAVEELVAGLNHDNHRLAVEIASLPDGMRGFGHVKEANVAKVKEAERRLLDLFRKPAVHATAAE